MSGKHAKVQKRRRWCDHGLQVTQAYRLQLEECCREQNSTQPVSVAEGAADTQQQQPSLADKTLAQRLLRFISIQFTYGEVEELKTSITAAERLAGATPATCPTWAASMQLLLELLFFENSRPLHKQILAFVRKLPSEHQHVVGQLLNQRIQQAAVAVLSSSSNSSNDYNNTILQEKQQQQSTAQLSSSSSNIAATAAEAVALLQQQPPLSPTAAQQGLTLAQAAVSLLWLPTARDWLTVCSPVLLLAVAHSVHSTLSLAGQGQHLTPNTMELVQDAISVLYYTLQHQGQYMLSQQAGVLGAAAVAAAAECMLEALQGTALVREAMASAAVVVWSAAVLPSVPPAAAAAAFAAGLLHGQLPANTSSDSSSSAWQQQCAWGSSSLLEQLLIVRGTCLVDELRRASAVGRICALKGLLTAMPADALTGDLTAWLQTHNSSSSSSSTGRSFIMHCVLPFAVNAARSAPDAHYKFHAVSVIAVVLQRAKQLWQELVQKGAAAAAAAVQAADGSSSITDAMLQQQPCFYTADDTIHTSSSSSSTTVQLVAPLLSGARLSSVVELLWGNLDEPMAQTLAKIQDAFEALLALLVYQDTAARQLHITAAAADGTGSSGCGSGTVQGFGSWHDTASFLAATAAAVLAVAPNRKGRYGPLTALLQYVGAKQLLQQQPQLVQQVLAAMQDDMVANTATGFFKALLLQLRREETAAVGVLQQGSVAVSDDDRLLDIITDPNMRSWCAWWLPSLLAVLWGPDERFRTYVTNHALPVVLQAEPLLLRPVVSMIMATHAGSSSSSGAVAAAAVGVGVPNATAALVVVLKAARKMQLVGDLDTLLPPQQQQHGEAAGTAVAGSSSSSSGVGSFSPAAMLLSAVSSSSAALRMETLELACVNARSTEAPGELELSVARRWLLLCLRCTGAGSRSKSLVMWEKLLTRQRAAVAAIRHRAATAKRPGATGGAHPASLPKAAPNYLAAPGTTTAAAAAASDAAVLQRQYTFINWLSQTLMDSLYPGGPYERKYYALQLLAVLLAQWKPSTHDVPSSSSSSDRSGSSSSSDSAAAAAVMPLCVDLLSSSAVDVLLGCLVDTWDKLRMAASSVLELLPCPLPGLGSPQQLLPLLSWATQLTHSPRVRESDAGARLLRVLLIKYGLGLNWQLQLYPKPDVAAAAAQPGSSSSDESSSASDALVRSVVTFLSSLTGQLRRQLLLAKNDITAASRQGLVHGVVLTLRYAADEVPWMKLASSDCTVSATVSAAAAAAAAASSNLQQQQQQSADGSNSSSGGVSVSGPAGAVLRVWLADLLQLLAESAQLAQPYLSAQDLNMAADEVEEDAESACSDDELLDLDDHEIHTEQQQHNNTTIHNVNNSHNTDAAAAVNSNNSNNNNSNNACQPGTGTLSGPAIQVLITACWTSVKEISLLIGTLARRLPLPGSSSSSSDLLQPAQLAQMGDLLLSLLLTMKHNGAVEKSQPGFLWLCEQLLQSPAAVLNAVPGGWLQRCLERVQQQGQCRDDIVRRSAGLPFAVCCLFLCEPHGVPRQLLPLGLMQLLDIAGSEEHGGEPWPRVHAFNCLRCVFNDAALALDSSGYQAAGVVAAIRGMEAGAWEVRNAAALTFTALVTRVIGYKNAGNKQHQIKPLQQLAASPADLNLYFKPSAAAALGFCSSSSSSSAKAAVKASWCVKSPTASDFFYRYPQLHGFLLEQLQNAAALLDQAASSSSSSTGSSSSNEVPPSLFPVLVILSRLKPSLMLPSNANTSSSSTMAAAAVGQDGTAAAAAAASAFLSPDAFIPAVLAVGRSPVMGVRQIAAASLAPLVAADKLHSTCLALALLLPHQPAQLYNSTAAAAARSSSSSSDGAMMSHNALHGTLLQLTALLRAVAASNGSSSDGSSSSSARVAALVAELLPSFVTSSWLASSSSRCSSAVRQAYIAAAGQLVMLAYVHWAALLQLHGSSSSSGDGSTAAAAIELLQELVSSLHTSCMHVIQQTVPTTTLSSSAAAAAAVFLEASDPQYCCCLRDCTALLLGHLLRMQLLLQQYSQPQQQQQYSSRGCHCVEGCSYVEGLLLQLHSLLQICMASSSYEVRASALKAAAVQFDHVLQLCPLVLPGVAGSTAVHRTVQQLQQQLWCALENEQTSKVLKRLLVVLGQLQAVEAALLQQQQQQGCMPAAAADHDSIVLQRLRGSLAVAKQYKQLEVRITALKCAARELQPAITAVCNAAKTSACSSSSTVGVFGQYSGQYMQYIQQLLQLLQQCSSPNQQEEVREAAAHALSLSGLLAPLAAASGSSSSSTVVNVARLSLAAWHVALRLMEDEEDMVRQPAADAVQIVLQAVPHAATAVQCGDLSTMSSVMQQLTLSDQQNCTARPDVQISSGTSNTSQYVEAVEQYTFDLLSKVSGLWPDLLPDLLQLLSGVVFDHGTAVPEVIMQQWRRHEKAAAAVNDTTTAAGAGATYCADASNGTSEAAAAAASAAGSPAVLAGVLVRRMFEKEADNHHEEPVLLAQLAAAALHNTLQYAAQQQQHGACEAMAAAHKFMNTHCQILIKFLRDTLSKMAAVSSSSVGGWIGGDTNHPEVFVPLYRCLLGLLASAPYWTGQGAWSQKAADSADAAQSPAVAAAVVKGDVQQLVCELLQLQPTVLLHPVLLELQAACAGGVGGGSLHGSGRRRNKLLFLTQRE